MGNLPIKNSEDTTVLTHITYLILEFMIIYGNITTLSLIALKLSVLSLVSGGVN